MHLDVFFRFDDETGEIHNPRIDRNALRHLFTKKTERERLEKQQRETILQVLLWNFKIFNCRGLFSTGAMDALKGSKFQNEFMRSSFLPKSQTKITETSALEGY